jgi:hypothetical protein
MHNALAIFSPWYGAIFGVAGAVLATPSRASIRQGLIMTAGLFWVARPWYAAWLMGAPLPVDFLADGLNALLGTVPLVACYLPLVWVGKRIMSRLRRPSAA